MLTISQHLATLRARLHRVSSKTETAMFDCAHHIFMVPEPVCMILAQRRYVLNFIVVAARGIAVTSLGVSTKLLYVGPG